MALSGSACKAEECSAVPRRQPAGCVPSQHRCPHTHPGATLKTFFSFPLVRTSWEKSDPQPTPCLPHQRLPLTSHSPARKTENTEHSWYFEGSFGNFKSLAKISSSLNNSSCDGCHHPGVKLSAACSALLSHTPAREGWGGAGMLPLPTQNLILMAWKIKQRKCVFQPSS